MKKTDLAYLAGFFDGEGSIHIDKNCALRCSVTNTNKWILELFHFNFGGAVTKSRKTDVENRKPCYVWSTHAQNTLEFLKAMFPYLRLKKAEAQLGIEFQTRKQGQHFVSPYHMIPDDVRVLREADRILMKKLKK